MIDTLDCELHDLKRQFHLIDRKIAGFKKERETIVERLNDIRKMKQGVRK